MPKILADQVVGYGDQVVFTTPGRYSMDTAVGILQQLEDREGCVIHDTGWSSSPYGSLAEDGIQVRLGDIEFRIMCSYENIFISRISGNKAHFREFCVSMRDMDITAT